MTSIALDQFVVTPLPLDVEQPITTVENLADHLHVAAKVEMSTIPLYLYPAYSIRTKGHSQWSVPRGVIRTLVGIAVEEMLHLALVRNLYTAIRNSADQPLPDIKFYDNDFFPKFPGYMLHREPPLKLELRRLSKEHVETFVELEKPDMISVDDLRSASSVGQYTSLGAFYRKIEEGFSYLDDRGGILWTESDIELQYGRAFWNQFGGGKPARVNSLDTAKKALKVIVEQGEGTATDHTKAPKRPDDPQAGFEEYTHYWKFVRIRKGIEGIGAGDGSKDYDFPIDDPRATWPLVDNPKIKDFENKNPAAFTLMNLFNAAYSYLMCILDKLYRTSTRDVVKRKVGDRVELFSGRYGLERHGIAAMQGILYPIAELLVQTPAVPNAGVLVNAGPSFEFYAFRGSDKKAELISLCKEAITYHPSLGGNDGVLERIRLMSDVD